MTFSKVENFHRYHDGAAPFHMRARSSATRVRGAARQFDHQRLPMLDLPSANALAYRIEKEEQATDDDP